MNFLDITLAEPYNFYFFPLLLSIGLLILVNFLKKVRLRKLLSGSREYTASFVGYKTWKSILPLLLSCVGLTALGFVLVRPQWGTEELSVQHKGRHLFIALDVSRSMLAQDIKPSRLEVAKRKIKALAELLKSDMIGLILFAGDAFVQCPLTTDSRAFSMFLNHVDAQTISGGTTALDKALYKTLDSFKSSSASTKLVVVFTDGEDFSTDLKNIKEQAKKENLIIFTTGVGTLQGAPIPVVDAQGITTDHQKDEKGMVVISRLDPTLLYSLAHECGGTYVASTEDSADMKAIATHIENFEKEMLGDQTTTQRKDRYHYGALVAYICFLLEWII